MATLSVVLATFNEEENLPSCLDAIKDIASEIVVVDGGSKDKTVEIAKQYKAKVFITDNPQVFHINKQKAIDKASKDWILQLDADEIVSQNLKNEIMEKIEYPDADGYWIPRKNYFLGRYLMKGGQYPDYTMRLYKRGKGRLPQETVHEQAVVNGKVGYLRYALLHYADPTFKRYLIRFSRYTDLIATQLKDKKHTFFLPIEYLFIQPLWWFLVTYIRHKGFMDSWQGFVFSFFSALRFPIGYIKYLRNK